MKRFLAVLFVCVCLLSMTVPALAAPDTITVTAEMPDDWDEACVYIWDSSYNALAEWPGLPMTRGADGRFVAQIPAGYDYIIINDGGNGYQTGDIEMDGDKDIWIYRNDTYHYYWYYDPGIQNAGGGTTPDDDTVTVHAYVPDDFDTPHLWAWEENYPDITNAFDFWPGKTMEKNGDWWTHEMPDTCNYIIINDTYYQTADLSILAGRDVWVVVRSDWTAEIFYSEPSPEYFNPPIPESLYIVGTGLPGIRDWLPDEPNGRMEGSNGVFTIDLDLEADDSIAFKFAGDGTWDTSFGAAASSVTVRPENNYLLEGNGGEFFYHTSQGCTLRITADLNNNILSLEELVQTAPRGNYTIHAMVPSGVTNPYLYAWGSSGSMGSSGEKMDADGDWYTLTFSDIYEYFQITAGSDSTDDIAIPSQGTEFWVVIDAYWNHKIYDSCPIEERPLSIFRVYAPDATLLEVKYELDGLFHYAKLTADEDADGWWYGDVPTGTELILTGDAKGLEGEPFVIDGIDGDTWVVINEEGDHTVSQEDPETTEEDSKKKKKDTEDTEDAGLDIPIIVWILIGVGVVALGGIVVLVLLIVRRRQ